MASGNGNMSIAGTGIIGAGTYADVRVSGSGRIVGPVESASFRVSGTLVGEAPLVTGSLRVSGSATSTSDVKAGTAVVSGSLTAGSLVAETLSVSGVCDVARHLGGGKVQVSGGLSVGEDCEVEEFKAQGAFHVGGLLSADTIKVKMHGACSASEIGGESIDIRAGRKPFMNLAAALGFTAKLGLDADTVEGDIVYLERAKVRTLRGREIHLGEGCEVALVEYTGELTQSPSAKAKTVRKIDGSSEAKG